MRKGIFYITVLAGLILFWGGKPYHTIQATVQADTNLISNSNFTADTLYSDTGWVLNYRPDNPRFVNDAPPSDSLWSLGLIPSNIRLLTADYLLAGGAEKSVNLFSNISIIKLTFGIGYQLGE